MEFLLFISIIFNEKKKKNQEKNRWKLIIIN